MNYNDFSLPQNWENLAKAYTKALKDKGFVFVRLNQNQATKNTLASTCFFALKNLETLYSQVSKRVSGKQSQAVGKLSYLSQELLAVLEKTYQIETATQLQSKKTGFNFITNIFSFETTLIKNLTFLLDEEDQTEPRAVLKNNLISRLETLENAF